MFVVPMLQITLLLWVLAFASVALRAPAYRYALVVLHRLRPWSMTEVFLLGALVAIVKLSAWVHVVPGEGIWALGGLTILLAILSRYDSRAWWDIAERAGREQPADSGCARTDCVPHLRLGFAAALDPESRPMRALRECVRARTPRSAEHTLAWLLAGMILYIPANLLPVMYTSGVQGGQESTILSGVDQFLAGRILGYRRVDFHRECRRAGDQIHCAGPHAPDGAAGNFAGPARAAQALPSG